MLENLRLAWRLFWDREVGLPNKLIPLLAVLYVLSPIDIIPDLIPVLGVTDDVGVFILALDFFIRSAPDGIVRYHRDILEGVITGKSSKKNRE
ncbi:MAG: DUF1232 domain-containing protein [Chloroflexi bacterium]|nr:DUF1232 domain-containing protein [Chloroflexota bacterium]